MVDAPRLTGQDGKTLPWRQTGGASPLRAKWGKEPKERTRKGDRPGRPYREGKPVLRVARGCFYVTTRINSEKWEKLAGKRGIEGISSHVMAFLSGFVGHFIGFEAGAQKLFWKTNA